jgi:hypothetical protein
LGPWLDRVITIQQVNTTLTSSVDRENSNDPDAPGRSVCRPLSRCSDWSYQSATSDVSDSKCALPLNVIAAAQLRVVKQIGTG